jgi:hypothetical protein
MWQLLHFVVQKTNNSDKKSTKNEAKHSFHNYPFEGLMPDLVSPTQRGVASGIQHNFF